MYYIHEPEIDISIESAISIVNFAFNISLDGALYNYTRVCFRYVVIDPLMTSHTSRMICTVTVCKLQ